MKPSFLAAGLVRPRGRRGRWSALAEWWGPRPWTQIAVILGIAAVFLWLGLNVAEALRRAGISPGFAFLGRSAGFQIGEAPIAFSAGDSYLRAILAGLLNTLKVAVAGCVLTTILGVAVGVAGLSGNPLMSRLVKIYIEVIRNTPLLLQLFFWIALARNLPGPRQAFGAAGVLLSNRGIFLPMPVVETGWLLLPLLPALMLAILAVRRRRARGRDGTPAGIAFAAFAALLLWQAGLSFDRPELQGFNIRGGISLSPEFGALLVALTVKFSASIAEIVRAGILSVPESQREAARALGLSERRIMRLVVLPQALRVIVPLITSCFLDLTKDSSLAVAIGYPDLVSILNTTANTTGQAIEALLIMTGTFVVLNLAVAWLMNVYNRRVALRGEVRR
ncbi:ABC transporter permease subunit [Sinirhodobacter populi]|uniref:ABC transporter permease subunit n=1 Tax=Paenirhodobacter populi TaxID=2306993 RepID=A0A443KP96_9RHOB|nr:ABC transporter permease subunit [Sinirhodobacter populi]RWR34629.1 ABC transporter permease subunit [Sinirhodobacter populi]